MKKIRKRIVIIMLAMFVVTLGGCKMEMKEDKIATKEEQIEFLKKHEAEMTEYVKSQNKKIESVQFDWNSTKLVTVGNGTPQGGGKVLEIFGYVNDDVKKDFSLFIEPQNENLDDISSIYYGSGPED